MADELADRAADVSVDAPERLAKGYRSYERYRLTLRTDGNPHAQERDILRGGPVVAVLPVDLARDEVVLIRQFRLAAHLADGKGDLIEIVAGGVEEGEGAAEAARRECAEEIGAEPKALVELLTYLSTPGITDEEITLFVASVDAAKVPARTSDGGEHIEIMRVPIERAIAALGANTMRNGPLLIALQWLALNRGRLPALLGAQR